MLREQREANETLVLTSLRAHEAADAAIDETNALKETAEFRERLIGIIGHDLKNPLCAIILAGTRLTRRGTLTDDDAGFVRLIVKSGERMERMISELVEFTRARLGGGFDLRRSVVDLGDVCRTIADELRIGASVTIALTGEGDLTGRWDGGRLAEVVSNLAGNAVDHAAAGTAVRIHVRGDGDSVVAEITNDGESISPELLPHLFNAFHRESARSDSGHLGLGLYIAHEITRAHGGTLVVRSAHGTTTFSVRLPRSSAC